jgi:2-methylisocitrate lyase-like PEP mutase family enzyme
MNTAQNLKNLLTADTLALAPGAPDALTARLIESAGFPAVYMTGFGATASLTGCPDVGILTQTEMTTHARNMVRAVKVPVIADADTGYGGPANIERTVREYLQAGVAAIHIEDQAIPKRCGHMAGIKLVSVGEMTGRLKGAIEARGDSDLLIIGRTDALAATGRDEAIRRALRYREAGVDLVFVDAMKTIADAEAVAREVPGPLMMSIVEGHETTRLLPQDLKSLGYAIALYPLSALFAATRAMSEVLQSLQGNGTTLVEAGRMATYAEFSELVRLDHFRSLDDRFGVADSAKIHTTPIKAP